MLGKTHKPTKPIYASVFLFCKVSIWVPSSWNHRPEESMCLLCSRLDQHSIKCMICWLMPHLTSPGRPSRLSVLVAILESPGRVWSWHPPHLGYFLLIVIFFFFYDSYFGLFLPATWPSSHWTFSLQPEGKSLCPFTSSSSWEVSSGSFHYPSHLETGHTQAAWVGF